MRRTPVITSRVKQEVDIGLRPNPRKEYLEECSSPPEHLTSREESPLRLVLMDLNGTLLYRRSRSAMRPTAPNMRPFSRALMRYCLGHGSSTERGTKWAGQRSHGPYEVGIWSSAREDNVQRMMEKLLPPGDPLRQRLIGIWGRSTLAPKRWVHSNIQVTKDLEVIWAVLNLGDTSRLDATRREQEDLGQRENKSLRPEKEHVLASAKGPWGPRNTILLDDSLRKAKLHPFNALLPLEFGRDETAAIEKVRFEATRIAGLGLVSLYPKEKDGQQSKGPSEDEDTLRERAWDLVLRTDTSLLQVVGLLDEALQVGHVGHWIREGGTQGFPLAETHLLRPEGIAGPRFAGLQPHSGVSEFDSPVDSLATDLCGRLHSPAPFQDRDDQLYWIVRGVQAYARRGIPLNMKHDVLSG